jgi:5-methylthioadenosine/S-adenosylhomocysteine deaminase
MLAAALLAKGVAGDATAVPAWQALRMATLNGATALGMGAETGSLEIGKQADMIALRMDGVLELEPMFSVISHLVYAADRSHVTDVWVAGQQLLADRHLTTIDEAAVLRDCKSFGATVRPGGRAEDKATTIDARFRRCC